LKFFTLIATATILATTLPAPAAEELPGHLKTCVTLRRDAERLACYDKAVAQLQNGTDSPPPSAENMFGANTDILAAPGNRDIQREELQEIKGVVTSLRRADDGMIVLGLDNGQTWRQQDSDVSLTIDTGDSVMVMRASLGTFRIADKRGRSARFKRVR
jgi:hypothetical protein